MTDRATTNCPFAGLPSLVPTWILVEYLSGVVEVRVPVVPLAADEAQLLAGHAHVGRRPVLGVGADGAPRARLEHLHDALVHVGAVHQADRAVRLLLGDALERQEPGRERLVSRPCCVDITNCCAIGLIW